MTCHFWSKKMASLLWRSVQVSSNHQSAWMHCDIWSRQMASLLCGFFHVSSNPHSGWMPYHIWSRKMSSLRWGSFHVSSNDHFGWMTCNIWSRQMFSLLCGSFHLSPICLNALWHLEQANVFSHTWGSTATLLKFAVHAEKKKTECLCAAAVMLCTKGFFV